MLLIRGCYKIADDATPCWFPAAVSMGTENAAALTQAGALAISESMLRPAEEGAR